METARENGAAEGQALFDKLRTDILLMPRFLTPTTDAATVDMGRLLNAFPNQVFPTGAVHEFITSTKENAAASAALASAITSALATGGGACIWVHRCRRIFPPALTAFGVNPEQVVFVGAKSEKAALWATEEALKATGVAAVVAEIRDIDLTASRRLQLAVEKKQVTGLVLRDSPRYLLATAAAARWQVTPAPSRLTRAGMPGLGHPSWAVTLHNVKNGRPGSWHLEWKGGRFQDILPPAAVYSGQAVHRQAG